MSNWSAGTIGTVWIGMLCAGAVPATVNSTTERETTRLVMRHLARWGPPGTQDTQPTVGRVTGCHAGRALWRSRDDRSARQPSEVEPCAVFTPNRPLIGHCRVRAVWNAPMATTTPAIRPQ